MITAIELQDVVAGDWLLFKSGARRVRSVHRHEGTQRIFYKLTQIRNGRIGGFKPRPSWKTTHADSRRQTTYLLNDLRQLGVSARRISAK